MLQSKRETDWLDLVDMADKNNLQLEIFDSWTEVSYLKTLLPENTETAVLGELAGKKKNIFETEDKRYRYLVKVNQYIDAGNKRPIEQVKSVIKKMIIRQRGQNEIKFLEDSLLKAAKKEGIIISNITETKK